MTRLRISIAGLMAVVLIVAVGFAALRNANQAWASGMFYLVVVLLPTSLLRGIAGRGRERLACIGFAVFGWSYLLMAFWPNHGIPLPVLPTSALVEGLYPYLNVNGTEITVVRSLNRFTVYNQVGHSLGALCFALIGAVLGSFFAASSEGIQVREDHE
jgi:hypothetical protein